MSISKRRVSAFVQHGILDIIDVGSMYGIAVQHHQHMLRVLVTSPERGLSNIEKIYVRSVASNYRIVRCEA